MTSDALLRLRQSTDNLLKLIADAIRLQRLPRNSFANGSVGRSRSRSGAAAG
jgi:hypothetical protein